jgi:hypothetical protein
MNTHGYQNGILFALLPGIVRENPEFWRNCTIDADTGCWHWTGEKSGGYGRYAKSWAHRVAYEYAYGEIPNGLCVLHSCDCPDCINPLHLHVGTHSQNMREKADRGRVRVRPKFLSSFDVLAIRGLRWIYGMSTSEISEMFGISVSHCRNILNGNRWANA